MVREMESECRDYKCVSSSHAQRKSKIKTRKNEIESIQSLKEFMLKEEDLLT